MGLRNFFKSVKNKLSNLLHTQETKPVIKQVTTGSKYKPLRVINTRGLNPKHPLHKHHFGNFAPLLKENLKPKSDN